MKYKFIFSFLVSVYAGVLFGQTAEKIFPYPIMQKKLPNGLNVVTVPFNSPGIASLYLVVRAGSREEVEPGHTGFAHFFEHMMFRGTDKYSPDQYEEVMKSIGASANANTSIDRTMFYMTGNAGMLEKMFELEGDRFQHLKYANHDFKTEAGAVKGEYTKNSASPYTQISEKVVATAFEKHTYKHTTMGFFNDIVDMPNQYDYSITFFNRFYRPEYTTIIVVGDVKQADVNKYAEKYFGMWKKGNYQPKIEAEPVQTETKFTHLKVENFPPLVSLNYKGPAFSTTNKDGPALNLMMSILFGETSDIYQKLVVKERKVRGIQANAQLSRDPNLISISAVIVSAKDMQYVKDEITKVLENAKSNSVDSKKLADTKSNLKYNFAMALESPDDLASSLGRFTWLTGNPESINTFYALYNTITTQDIMDAAKKYFIPTSLTIGTISGADEGGIK